MGVPGKGAANTIMDGILAPHLATPSAEKRNIAMRSGA
jgi:hypothetical protein